MADRRQHTRDELQSYFRDRRNWGRWGDKGAAGAMNMIDAEKRVAAAALVKSGRTVSLSRPWPSQPSLDNPRPAQQYLSKSDLGGGSGWAFDYIGVSFHGAATTHIDALCHVWDEDGLWDGRDHTEAVEKHGIFGTPTFVFENGGSAYLKTFIPPAEDSVEFFDHFVALVADRSYVGEIKRPQPPWPKGAV